MCCWLAALGGTSSSPGYLEQTTYLIPYLTIYFKLHFINSVIYSTNLLFYTICCGQPKSKHNKLM